MASKNDWAIRLDGQNDYIQFGTSGLPTGDSPRTIEFWMKPEGNPTWQILIGYGNQSNLQRFEIGLNLDNVAGILAIHAWGDLIKSQSPVITTMNQWYHIAVVYEGGGLLANTKVYVNGTKINMTSSSGYGFSNILNTQATNFWIGRRSEGYYFKGVIDEVRLWNFARLEAQILADRYKVLTGGETGLVGYWRFEEGIGTLALDSSPTKNNGTLQNGAYYVSGEISLLAGQQIEEIGIPIDLSKGTFNNTIYKDGKIQLKTLYEIKASDGSEDPTYVGEGTAQKPFLIKDAFDFYKMRFQPSAYYKLVKDIDMAVVPFNEGQYRGFDFKGVLDGNGYKIMNFKQISRASYSGLFTKIMDNAVVKNLHIEDAYVECRGDYSNQGILAGQLQGSAIVDSVKITGLLKTRGRYGTVYAGAIGYISGGSITNVQVAINVDVDEAGYQKDYVGVLTGRLDSAVTIIEKVLVEGNIIGTTNNYNYMGIIAGYNYKPNIVDVYCNKDLITLGIPVTNNVAISGADKTDIELQDTRLYEKWDENIWRIKMWSKPKLKVFDKPTHALVEYGEWESDIIDMVDKYTAFKNLVSTQNVFEGAKVVILTKTSEDNNVWTPYVAIGSNGSVASPKARYAKVKVRIYPSKNRELSVVEGFSGNINYDQTPYIKTGSGKMTVNNQKTQEFTKVTNYTDGGFLYKTTIYVDDKRQLNKIRIHPK
jgi:hypothetical protein